MVLAGRNGMEARGWLADMSASWQCLSLSRSGRANAGGQAASRKTEMKEENGRSERIRTSDPLSPRQVR